MSKNDLLPKLEKLLKWKKSKVYYSEKLGVSIKEIDELLSELKSPLSQDEDDYQKVNTEKGTLESIVVSSFRPRDHEELAKLHKVDLSKYKITSYWTKQRGTKFTSSLLCTLIKKDSDLPLQKETLLEELMSYSPTVRKYPSSERHGKFAYEIDIFDMHFGKMSWGEESGEDYDLKIAEERYRDAIAYFLSMVDEDEIEEIIFPIGNDMINIDSRKNQTFAGTPQDSDSRFYKIVKVVKSILIDNINILSTIAPTRVIVVAGNHDPETMFMLGEILESYYHNNHNVSVDNSPKPRKYYQYGKVGLQYSHGNEENHKELGLIFATEQPHLWADTEYRFCKLGHFHKNKKTEYLSVDEHQGFQVQIIPSLCGRDAWHAGRGYDGKKQARAFLYHKERGQVGEFPYSVIVK